jgi:hypothetical protein
MKSWCLFLLGVAGCYQTTPAIAPAPSFKEDKGVPSTVYIIVQSPPPETTSKLISPPPVQNINTTVQVEIKSPPAEQRLEEQKSPASKRAESFIADGITWIWDEGRSAYREASSEESKVKIQNYWNGAKDSISDLANQVKETVKIK